jgi:homoserine dehydrogenase
LNAPLKIAVAGLGTVGAGIVQLLQRQADHLALRAGRPLVVTAVSARDKSRDRGADLSAAHWYDDAAALAADPEIDIVVELIGGSDGIGRKVVETALAHKKHVVTANKALMAEHGTALAEEAEAAGVALAFEAAVAGGIPIIKTLREGLVGNRLGRVYGILNGTTNYILTTMRESGRDFAEVLAEAQALGYAEADPSFDIDGVDASHKLAILASVAFGRPVDLAGVYCEGIRHISALDIGFAEELGYRIKLLGIARLTDHGLEQRVHPCMVRQEAPIAAVEGVFNGVVAEGDFVGQLMLEGRGAGAGPTASAVVADIVDIATGRRVPPFGVPVASLGRIAGAPMESHRGAYYIRLMVVDQPGVIADVAAALRDEAVSLESMIQRGRSESEAVPVVLTTHVTVEAAMRKALAAIGKLKAVLEPPRMIRIEDF